MSALLLQISSGNGNVSYSLLLNVFPVNFKRIETELVSLLIDLTHIGKFNVIGKQSTKFLATGLLGGPAAGSLVRGIFLKS